MSTAVQAPRLHLFPPFSGASRHQVPIAETFQSVWSRTQRELPPGHPDRARPVKLHYRDDPAWQGWQTPRPLWTMVDLAELDHARLPEPARRANLETAAFVDGWLTDHGRKPDPAAEHRLVLLLFVFWSTIRLNRDGHKRDGSIADLPPAAIAAISSWRTLSLTGQPAAVFERLVATRFRRTPYQAALDRRMIAAAIDVRLNGKEVR
ncbi:hypothetical protein SAMN05421504_108271 [Amycolatopsis xylanica]|uniref:Uncharacterized protein n=1 Tax=Amycolatopsis xylanica TaxID=589385 RepID=A0A1H3PL30_9PSEU|nr:hypothetical protein [Amycolatopsis xylanica]SDZ01707.1 hypothetical protein SAMN05421504_108271 [Amycolatopsis xylanica]